MRKSISNKRVHAYNRIFVVWGRKPTDEEVVAKKAEAEARSGTAIPSFPSSTRTAATTAATENIEKPSDRVVGHELPAKEEVGSPLGTAVPTLTDSLQDTAPVQTNSRPGTAVPDSSSSAKGKNIEGTSEKGPEEEASSVPDTTVSPPADSAREDSSERVFSSMSLNDPLPEDESPAEKKI